MQSSKEMRLSAPWQTLPGLNKLLAAFGSDGEIRFVGGCVRDAVVGQPANDIDCATRWRPEIAAEKAHAAGFQVIPTGLKHGTITVLLPEGQPIEITTLRRDAETDGRHALVEFTEDWEIDAARRDFTINALSANPFTGEIYDYFGGLRDLSQGRVRFIGDAIKRIEEDHLRVLRFFRFHQRYGQGHPDSHGIHACRARASFLNQLSAERIASEILKMLANTNAAAIFSIMLKHEILDWILPEIKNTDGLKLLEDRERTLSLAADPLRRLAALLNNYPQRAQAIARRLKLSNADRERLMAATDGSIDNTTIFDHVAYVTGPQTLIDRALLAKSIDLAQLHKIVDTYSTWQPPALPIKGGELIAMGLEPGPIVSQTLREIENEWLVNGFPSRAETLKIAERIVAANRPST